MIDSDEVLTLKMVVDANIASLEGTGRKLGAMHGHTNCLYRYPDGCGCAIGVALPETHTILSNLSVKIDPSSIEINSLDITCVAVKKYLVVESMYEKILLNIQMAHDRICHAQEDKWTLEVSIDMFKAELSKAFRLVYPGKELPEVLLK